MIDVMVTLRVNDEPLTMFGKVDEEQNRIIMNYQIISKTIEQLDLIHHPAIDMPLIDTSAKHYSAYGCKFTKKTLSFDAGTVKIEGTFQRLLRERNLGCQYDTVRFSFEGIEQFFPLERFTTQFESEEQQLAFVKEKSNVLEFVFHDDTLCKVESAFVGARSSYRLYDLNVKQIKNITFVFKAKVAVDAHLQFIIRVKKYFEYLLGQEIKLYGVAFYNQDNPALEEGELMFDPLIMPKTYIKSIRENPYRKTHAELFAGLDGWLNCYEVYQRVIEIWQKTIYNQSISGEDLFLWRCQAFELLCTLNQDIFREADSYRVKGQSYPNLKNFLLAVKKLFGIMNIPPEYFRDVKNSRDALTHNNPSKKVTENQMRNSQEIIKVALDATIAQVMGIPGVSSGYSLGPHSK